MNVIKTQRSVQTQTPEYVEVETQTWAMESCEICDLVFESCSFKSCPACTLKPFKPDLNKDISMQFDLWASEQKAGFKALGLIKKC